MLNEATSDVLDLGRAPSLAAARAYSGDVLARARAALAGCALPALEAVAVGGSLGRLEAGPAADFDCLLIACDGAPRAAVQRDVETVMTALADLGLALPKADGIYREAVTRAALLDPAARGRLDEAPAIFGKRMQCLLDARPLAGAAAFVSLRAAVVDWYAADFVSQRPRRSWTALVNDLQRYLHSYAVWQQFKLASSADDSWALRQAKFRSSRVVTFAALLCLLGASNDRDDKIPWLLARLDATPLERLAQIMRAYDADAFARLLDAYDTAHALLSDRHVRAALIATPVETALLGAEGPVARMRAASGTVLAILTRFILARSADWDERFFTRLIL
ncbi:MAG: hypothetical protein RLW62_03000 [Gammaproteobacteria bacterium]